MRRELLQQTLDAQSRLITDAQRVLTDYLIPDGIDGKEAISRLLGLFGGPQQRAFGSLLSRQSKLYRPSLRNPRLSQSWIRKGVGFRLAVPNGVNDQGKPRTTHYTFADKPEPDYGSALDTFVYATAMKEAT